MSEDELLQACDGDFEELATGLALAMGFPSLEDAAKHHRLDGLSVRSQFNLLEGIQRKSEGLPPKHETSNRKDQDA